MDNGSLKVSLFESFPERFMLHPHPFKSFFFVYPFFVRNTVCNCLHLLFLPEVAETSI